MRRTTYLLLALAFLFFAIMDMIRFIRGEVPTSSTIYLLTSLLWIVGAVSHAERAEHSNRRRN